MTQKKLFKVNDESWNKLTEQEAEFLNDYSPVKSVSKIGIHEYVKFQPSNL